MLPIVIEGTIIRIEQAAIQELLVFLNTNLLYTVISSSVLVLVGVFSTINNFRAWGRGLKAAPMGIVRSVSYTHLTLPTSDLV